MSTLFRLTPRMQERICALVPGESAERIVYDRRGIHHKTTPAASFVEAVGIHAGKRNRAVAETLLVVERLVGMDVLGPQTTIRSQGASVQAFTGTPNRPACHVMPCQLLFNNQLPFPLFDPKGRPLNGHFLHHMVRLFGECELLPSVVNRMDKLFDWKLGINTVALLEEAVKDVLRGNAPEEVFREFQHQEARICQVVGEKLSDSPLTVGDLLSLAGVVTDEETSAPDTRRRAEEVLGDKKVQAAVHEQAVEVAGQYEHAARITPPEVSSGTLRQKVNYEEWSSSSGGGGGGDAPGGE